MGKVKKEQITEWESKYGKITEIVLGRQTETLTPEGSEKPKEKVINPGKVGYLRSPDRATIKYAATKIKEGTLENSISAGEIILKKCWLGGDEEILEDDKYYIRAAIRAYDLLNRTTGFLEAS